MTPVIDEPAAHVRIFFWSMYKLFSPFNDRIIVLYDDNSGLSIEKELFYVSI